MLTDSPRETVLGPTPLSPGRTRLRVARPKGFEPLTSAFGGQRSIQLGSGRTQTPPAEIEESQLLADSLLQSANFRKMGFSASNPVLTVAPVWMNFLRNCVARQVQQS